MYFSNILAAALIGICLPGPIMAQADGWYTKPLFSLASSDLHRVDARPFLNTICPGRAFLHAGKGGTEMGCSTCPPGSDFYIDRNTMSQSLTAITFGHFTSAAADDALLSMSGCESHSNRFGGSYLLTNNAGHWKPIGYTSGVITEQCHKIPTTQAREILVCSHYFSVQGFIERFLYAVDFQIPRKPRVTRLLRVGNGLRNCGQGPEKGNPPVPQSIIESVSFREPNNTSVASVSIVARTGDYQRSEAEYRACVAWSAGAQWKQPPPVRTPQYRIDYVLQGSRLTATRRSAPALKHFED